MNIVINEQNLQEKDLQEQKTKVRAIILTQDNKFLVGNYSDILLLPGGKIDENETKEEALIRELQEEIGIEYNQNELTPFISLEHYQANYTTRNGNIINKKVTTHYYLAHYKGVSTKEQILTEQEQKNNFYLELPTIGKLIDKLSQPNNKNPRDSYFKKELKVVLFAYIYTYILNKANPEVIENLLMKILENNNQIYREIANQLTDEEYQNIKTNIEEKTCRTCMNGTCRVPNEEKSTSENCIGWENPEIIGKIKLLQNNHL